MNGSRKRVKCTSPNEELNTVLWDWYAKITSSNVPASGPLIQDKISQLAVKLNNNKFKASNGWLYRFCQRHDIRQITFQREGGVDKHIVDSFKALFPIWLRDMRRNIFTIWMIVGYFGKLLEFQGIMGKWRKERMKVSLCCNMAGDFKKLFLICKSVCPRAFSNI